MEICAVFVADTSQLINGIAGIFQDPNFDVQPVMGTITPQMTGSATGMDGQYIYPSESRYIYRLRIATVEPL